MALTLNQYRTVKEVRRIVEETNQLPNHQILADAHRIGYAKLAGATAQKVSRYVRQNLHSASFLKALRPLTDELIARLAKLGRMDGGSGHREDGPFHRAEKSGGST